MKKQTNSESPKLRMTIAHLRLFARSPLWWGAPLTAAVAFAATFLIRMLGDGLPVAEGAVKGAIFGAVGAFCWAVGIWAATDPAPDEEEEPDEEEPARSPLAAWGRRALAVAIVVGGFALLCAPQIEEMWTGETSLARGFTGIVLKAIAIAAVVLPLYLVRRSR